MKLYEINEAISALIDTDTGEIADFEAFEQLILERSDKLENIALWIKNLSSDARSIRDEERVLAERRKAIENHADRLEQYLAAMLGDGEKFETARVKLSWRKSAALRLTVSDDDFVAAAAGVRDDWLTYTPPSVNKRAVTDAIRAGVEVVGAELVERNNLQIK